MVQYSTGDGAACTPDSSLKLLPRLSLFNINNDGYAARVAGRKAKNLRLRDVAEVARPQLEIVASSFIHSFKSTRDQRYRQQDIPTDRSRSQKCLWVLATFDSRPVC